ncbi:transglutaminase family protein [Thioclava sp. BHET1]|nr:transglutaminase family protein [Thioclava sp. BHET1]
MLYDIGLTLRYSYDRPPANGRHVLRLLPAALPGRQRVLASRLEILPNPSERYEDIDFFGNRTVEVAFRSGGLSEAFRLTARVDCQAEAPELDLSPDLPRLTSEIAAVASLGPEAPHHFLGPSGRIRLLPRLTDYAREVIAPDMTAIGALCCLGEALHRDMCFDAEATTVETRPEEAFDRRHGVCQDFSQIMIGCLRGMGIPAGYVSGFLRTLPPPGAERLAGADAMHAWVRVWCGVETGWVEYDPTNALMVGVDHIVVALGRDYDDVAPIRGVLRASGGQATEQLVDVIPLS